MLERERDQLMRALEPQDWENFTEESELFLFRRFREDNDVLMRARLAVVYERKEAARRAAEWNRRGVLIGDDLPRPTLTVNML